MISWEYGRISPEYEISLFIQYLKSSPSTYRTRSGYIYIYICFMWTKGSSILCHWTKKTRQWKTVPSFYLNETRLKLRLIGGALSLTLFLRMLPRKIIRAPLSVPSIHSLETIPPDKRLPVNSAGRGRDSRTILIRCRNPHEIDLHWRSPRVATFFTG